MSAPKCERCGMELKYHGETCTVGGGEAKHSFARPTGSVRPCPFCGTPQESGYLVEAMRPQQEGFPVLMVFCLSCAASAPKGIWNQIAPNNKLSHG